MQIKATMSYHLRLTEMKMTDSNKWCYYPPQEDVEKVEPLYISDRTIKLCSHFGKQSGSSSKC